MTTNAAITITLAEAFAFTGGTVTLNEDGVSRLSGGNIGLAYFPIWDEAYRPILVGKIYDHFMLREIGFETIDVFQLRMRSHMNNVMPFYNELYKTQLNLIDPLSTVNLKTLFDGTNDQIVNATGTIDAESDNKAGSRTINSDFPQSMLSGSSDYASSGADVNSNTAVTSNSAETNNSDSNMVTHNESNVSGYQGLPGDIINAYRAAILNIDMMILDALEPMFLQVFNTGDSYTQTEGYYTWWL